MRACLIWHPRCDEHVLTPAVTVSDFPMHVTCPQLNRWQTEHNLASIVQNHVVTDAAMTARSHVAGGLPCAQQPAADLVASADGPEAILLWVHTIDTDRAPEQQCVYKRCHQDVSYIGVLLWVLIKILGRYCQAVTLPLP